MCVLYRRIICVYPAIVLAELGLGSRAIVVARTRQTGAVGPIQSTVTW